MIKEISSTNDFFMKPSQKKTPAETNGAADEIQSVSPSVNKKPLAKSDFASKLKSVEAEPRQKTAEVRQDTSKKVDLKERFSDETSERPEAPIQKRSPQSQRALLNEVPSQKIEKSDEEDFSPTEKLANPKSTQKENVQEKLKALLGQLDEESFADAESPISEVKSDPTLQLLALVASPQFDIKNLSPKELKEVKDVIREQQADMKQASVQKFMSQLQTQFGITPEKVVQAFAKMDEKSLTAPPSETINQFVNNLQVPPAARPKVAELYRQMLSETGEAALNEKLLGDDDKSSVSMKVLDSTQMKLEQLNKSLDNLNDNFFRNTPLQVQNNQQLPPNIREQLRNLTKNNSDDQPDTKAASSIGALIAQATGKAAGATTSQAAAGAQAASETAATSTPVPSMNMSALSQVHVGKNLDQSEFGQSQNQGQEEQSRGTKNYANQNTPNIAAASSKNYADVVKMSGKGEATVQAKSLGVDASGAGVAVAVNANAVGGAAAGTTAAALTPQQMMTPGPNQKDATESAQEIIKQAQIIIKKGGGEMNVEMKPEGMGQVHLKVALDNGQVNIQMMAQNDKVKKLLEEGIHELKSNLVAHKLQVESLKIGIANGALQDKQLEHQQSEGQREAMRDSQREFASNFMGQQREDRENMRQGFTEIPGWRAYRDDQKRLNVEATDTEMSGRRRDETRRLSLIA